jgi:hypothetical protein
MKPHARRLLATAAALFALAGCAAFWKAAPAALDTAACALAHKDEWSWQRLVVECGVTKENEQAILDLIAAQKAREAAIRREAAACKQ